MTTHSYRLRHPIYRLAMMLGFCLTGTAASAAEPQGWYAGIAYTDTNVEVFRGLGWEEGPSTSGYSLFGGRRVTKHIAVDFALQHTGDLQWTEYWAEVPGFPSAYTADERFDADALEASVVGIWPVVERCEVTVKGGIASYRLDGEQLLTDWTGPAGPAVSRSASTSGVGYLLGFGFGVTVAKSWHVSVAYEFFDIEDSFLGTAFGDDATVDSMTLAVSYRFGKLGARAD